MSDTVLRKKLDLTDEKYFQTHLNIVNCLLPVQMTPREIEVVAAFMSLSGDYILNRFGPKGRKHVMSQLILTPAGLSNYVTSLLDKGFLYKQGDIIQIRPILIPNNREQTYVLKLVNNHITNGTLTTVTE